MADFTKITEASQTGYLVLPTAIPNSDHSKQHRRVERCNFFFNPLHDSPGCLGLDHNFGHSSGPFTLTVDFTHPTVDFRRSTVTLQCRKSSDKLGDFSKEWVRGDYCAPA